MLQTERYGMKVTAPIISIPIAADVYRVEWSVLFEIWNITRHDERVRQF